MSYRNENRLRSVLEVVISNKKSSNEWQAESTIDTARKDAVKILESVLAEFGEESCLQALENQGFKSASYEYVLKPLYEESVKRRLQFEAHTKT
ncbi:TPA: hypothetical protein ACMDXF_004474 [Vibrio parahaemolyticus]